MLRVLIIIAALLAQSCGGGGGGSSSPSTVQPGPLTVVARDNSFDPQLLVVNSGDTVTWSNGGAAVHTATSGAPCVANGTWDSGSLAPGASFSRTFSTNGASFAYFCGFHCPAMTGTIVVNP